MITISADMFVAAEERTIANEVLNAALAQPANTENFARDLSPAGEAPATAHGAFASFTDVQWTAVRDALVLAAPQLSTMRYYARGFRRRSDGNANRLLECNSPTATASIGLAWSPSASMQDAGITPVVVALV